MIDESKLHEFTDDAHSLQATMHGLMMPLLQRCGTKMEVNVFMAALLGYTTTSLVGLIGPVEAIEALQKTTEEMIRHLRKEVDAYERFGKD